MSIAGVVIHIIKTSPEQFEMLLKDVTKKSLDKNRPRARSAEKRAEQQKELVAHESRYDNLQKAFEEQKDKLADAYKALMTLRRRFPAGAA